MDEPERERIFDQYQIATTKSRPPLHHRDVVLDSIVTDPQGSYAAIRISNCLTNRSALIEVRTEPLFYGGFSADCLIIPETGTCFVGAGQIAATYDLQNETRIELRKLDCGFWSWHRQLLGVVMQEELSIAVWTLNGRQLWEQFADPPHSFHLIDEARICLKDCRGEFKFDFETGRRID